MNIINPTITPLAPDTGRALASRTSAGATQFSSVQANFRDSQTGVQNENRSKNTNPRIVSSTATGVSIERYSRSADNDGRSSSQLRPASQYQNNQQLLQKEQLGGLLGIDVFA